MTWIESRLLPLARLHAGPAGAITVPRLEQAGRWEDAPAELNPAVRALLPPQLFAHQARAMRLALARQNVVISTGAGSGKTLALAGPILHLLLAEPSARAMLVMPTKALARDQLRRWKEWAHPLGLLAAVYDGDTPARERSSIRRHAHILITTPDMLHAGILPRLEDWIPFFRGLRAVAVDELHSMRGVFGSHGAWVMRRMKRAAAWQGSHPLLLAASATLQNPRALAEQVFDAEFSEIVEDAAPQGQKQWVLADAGENRDELSAAALALAVEEGRRAILFVRTRRQVEELAARAAELCGEASLIETYRGGHTAAQRRQAEKRLQSGQVLGVAATNALELGIDLDGMDLVIMNGFPGSIASFHQQAGRAGRAGRPGAVLLAASDDPMEQLFIRQPHFLEPGRLEQAIIDPANPHVAESQLLCGAYERGWTAEELAAWPGAQQAADDLTQAGGLARAGDRWILPFDASPAHRFSIRGSQSETIALFADGEIIGDMESWRACQEAHPGAIYQHRDRAYLVHSLRLEQSQALLTETDAVWRTRPLISTLAEPTVALHEDPTEGLTWRLCGVKVTTQTTGFRRLGPKPSELLREESLDLPASEFDTIGVILDLAPEAEPGALAAAVHGVQHALSAVAPIMAGCDPQDLSAAWFSYAPDTAAPRIIVFDQMAGGSGLAASLYARRQEWARLAAEALASCACAEGCPACLHSPRCECANQLLSKPGALELLQLWTERDSSQRVDPSSDTHNRP